MGPGFLCQLDDRPGRAASRVRGDRDSRSCGTPVRVLPRARARDYGRYVTVPVLAGAVLPVKKYTVYTPAGCATLAAE